MKSTHEIVTSCGKALHHGHLVPRIRPHLVFPNPEVVTEAKRGEPHHHKVQNHRDEYPEHRPEVMHDVMALVREHDEDGINQADEG